MERVITDGSGIGRHDGTPKRTEAQRVVPGKPVCGLLPDAERYVVSQMAIEVYMGRAAPFSA